jgi:hypothetical protein
LFLAGPGEFGRAGEEQPDSTLGRALLKAYDSLGYQGIYLAPETANWLTGLKNPLPPEFISVGKVPEVRRERVGGLLVGVTFLPPLPSETGLPDATTLAAIRNAAATLREDTNLVIGVSPWGSKAERAFLEEEGAVFDLLLGAGFGGGNMGRTMAQDKTLWLRAYSRGKVVQLVHLTALPQQAKDQDWNARKDTRTVVHRLDEQMATDPATAALFRGISK